MLDLQMKIQSLGMIEFSSIAAGIESADHMVKAAMIEPLFVKTICPGKFIVAVHGEVASVNSSVDAGLACAQETAVDHFVIANISPAVIPAMTATTTGETGPAIGVIETFSVPAAILAADMAAKAADVVVVEVRIAMGLGGKAFTLLSGDIASVEAAVEAGTETVKSSGLLVRKVVIPAMDSQLLQFIL